MIKTFEMLVFLGNACYKNKLSLLQTLHKTWSLSYMNKFFFLRKQRTLFIINTSQHLQSFLRRHNFPHSEGSSYPQINRVNFALLFILSGD